MGVEFGMTLYECNKVAGKMYEDLSPILHNYNVFICPTTAIPAVKADINVLKDKIYINGKEIKSPDLGWTMCYPFNMLCRLPVLSVPSGFSKIGVPTGIQIVGKPYEDIDVFQAGYHFEQIEPWYQSLKLSPSF